MTFYSPGDADYRWIRRLRRGEERLDPLFDTFLTRFRDEFGITPLAVKTDALTRGRDTPRPRLLVVLERRAEYDAFHHGEFGTPLRARHATARPLFVDSMSDADLRALFTLPAWESPIVRAEDVFLLFRDFETVAKRDAHAQVAGPELDAFVASLELGDRFWRTNRWSGPPIVFVQTMAQAEELSTPSTARRWADLYWPYVKAHDEFGYLRREEISVPVDSRENFEEGYEGNWYYYFK